MMIKTSKRCETSKMIDTNLQDLEKSSRVCNSWPFAEFLLNDEDRFLFTPKNETEAEKPTSTEKPISTENPNNSTKTVTKQAKKESPKIEQISVWSKCVNDSIKLLVEGKTKFISLYLEEPGRTAEIFGPDAKEVSLQD